jgi:hypothetical protein
VLEFVSGQNVNISMWHLFAIVIQERFSVVLIMSGAQTLPLTIIRKAADVVEHWFGVVVVDF